MTPPMVGPAATPSATITAFKPSANPRSLVGHEYLSHNRPLSSEAIRAVVEPLAGTSFGRIALDEIKHIFAEQRQNNVIHCLNPRDLYQAFFFLRGDDTRDTELTGLQALDAETALWSFLEHNVAVARVCSDPRLEPGEMAFHQVRHDDVWHDEEKTQYAYTHGTAQWQFFKNGQRRGHDFAIQWLYWQDWSGSHMVHILPDGSPNGRQFFDVQMQGIIALPKHLQVFKKYTNLLFVSDHFDFHTALRRDPRAGDDPGAPRRERL